MPLSEVAFAAGFASIRQFNETLRAVFDVTPSHLRSAARPHPGGGLTLRLAVRRPYDPGGVLAWLSARAIPGVEECATGTYRRALRLPGGPATVTLRPADDHVSATFRLTTMADLGTAVARCRRLLDLDADPGGHGSTLAADPALAPLIEAVPGVRLPGPVDGAEAAIRFLLGTAARTLTEPLSTPDGALTHMFAAPEAIAERRLPGPAGELARKLAAGAILLDEGADRIEVRRQLLAVRGLGPAGVEGIMLHALGDPDAFPHTDRKLRAAAQRHGLPTQGDALIRRAEQWRPWRGYAAHLLWRVGERLLGAAERLDRHVGRRKGRAEAGGTRPDPVRKGPWSAGPC
jgi:AraC family transcriptional regulator of adaptative response / DNA-3-methyladenine glycosylase II